MTEIATTPTRIRRHRTRGWKMPENTKCVTRPGKWGNPYKTAAEFERALDACFKQGRSWWFKEDMRRMQWIADHLHVLAGFNLACYCKPGDACHADVLLRYANNPETRYGQCTGCASPRGCTHQMGTHQHPAKGAANV